MSSIGHRQDTCATCATTCYLSPRPVSLTFPPHDRPSRQLLQIWHRRIRRTRRWQRLKSRNLRSVREFRQDLSSKEVPRFSAVEADKLKLTMQLEEAFEVICLHRIQMYRSVLAARSVRGFTNVPQRNPCSSETSLPFLIRQPRIYSKKIAHDSPECVPRLPVVLALSQRDLSRQRTENKDPCVLLGHWREPFSQHDVSGKTYVS